MLGTVGRKLSSFLVYMTRQANSHMDIRRGYGLVPLKWHANSRVGHIKLHTGLFGRGVGEIKVSRRRAVIISSGRRFACDRDWSRQKNARDM